ncbi:esterase-like activity of phytase family protein [Colwellia sp. MSW7]|uniref:Esterase-like activity of phytase family protein n=1 Tax=Colwellia maritima TaxID=2912588 RepID=A0ABS9X189_9GAMM|nr:esterase-like activity of phytase family protein [Colwellia maritima]MCI2283830.1 esterase-like activity of phytase family protein [Colwellia maritima]
MKHTKLTLILMASLGLTACGGDGDKGDKGEQGINGLNSLIALETLALGNDECFFGGSKIMSGLDTNADNILTETEITNTSTNCDVNPVSTSGSPLPHTVMRSDIDNGALPGSFMEIRNGGFGSDMVADPSDSTRFYALTDRGPNATFTGAQGTGKKFPTPDYTPRIGLFELQDNGDVKKIKDILLKRPDGTLITGLPNSSALGGTGETPYDADGNIIVEDMNLPYDETTNPIKLDDYGLDGEGLVALSDGTFWISDEYGPHMVHFNAEGIEIGRINAFDNDTRNTYTLPAEFANRRANRGMEGLTVTPDETTLVGIMQSTMYNPTSAVKVNDIVRIVTINLTNGNVSQYLYKQEKTQNSQSGIVALSETEFVVIERDGKFYNEDTSAMKHLYKIDISNATNIEAITTTTTMTQDDSLGLLIDGKTLEEVTLEADGWATLANAGINTINKTFLVDLVAETGYPHDKLEGMWLINDNTIGVINDDDFATWASGGVLEQKYLDLGQTVIDSNRLYIIEDIDLTH